MGGHTISRVRVLTFRSATCAAPTYFKEVTVGRHAIKFVDGALGANNPVFETRNSARDLWQTNETKCFDEQIHCLVSIGTGAQPGFSAHLWALLRNFASILTDPDSIALKFFQSQEHLVKSKKYFRLTVPAGVGNIDLADPSKLADISDRTFTYLQDHCHEQLEDCARALKSGYRPESEHLSCPLLCEYFILTPR